MNPHIKTISKTIGKKAPKIGKCPSVALVNPKYPHNVGAALRIASCYGMEQLWFTGNRIDLALGGKKRLPREERMKGYKNVELIQYDYFIDQFEQGVVPVAVEVRENSEPLYSFDHPKNALYIFGPEDGSIPSTYLRHCHRFIIIPTRHCLNLAMAVGTVLYDRSLKEYNKTGEGAFITPGEYEQRGSRREIEEDFSL